MSSLFTSNQLLPTTTIPSNFQPMNSNISSISSEYKTINKSNWSITIDIVENENPKIIRKWIPFNSKTIICHFCKSKNVIVVGNINDNGTLSVPKSGHHHLCISLIKELSIVNQQSLSLTSENVEKNLERNQSLHLTTDTNSSELNKENSESNVTNVCNDNIAESIPPVNVDTSVTGINEDVEMSTTIISDESITDTSEFKPVNIKNETKTSEDDQNIDIPIFNDEIHPGQKVSEFNVNMIKNEITQHGNNGCNVENLMNIDSTSITNEDIMDVADVNENFQMTIKNEVNITNENKIDVKCSLSTTIFIENPLLEVIKDMVHELIDIIDENTQNDEMIRSNESLNENIQVSNDINKNNEVNDNGEDESKSLENDKTTDLSNSIDNDTNNSDNIEVPTDSDKHITGMMMNNEESHTLDEKNDSTSTAVGNDEIVTVIPLDYVVSNDIITEDNNQEDLRSNIVATNISPSVFLTVEHVLNQIEINNEDTHKSLSLMNNNKETNLTDKNNDNINNENVDECSDSTLDDDLISIDEDNISITSEDINSLLEIERSIEMHQIESCSTNKNDTSNDDTTAASSNVNEYEHQCQCVSNEESSLTNDSKTLTESEIENPNDLPGGFYRAEGSPSKVVSDDRESSKMSELFIKSIDCISTSPSKAGKLTLESPPWITISDDEDEIQIIEVRKRPLQLATKKSDYPPGYVFPKTEESDDSDDEPWFIPPPKYFKKEKLEDLENFPKKSL